MTSVGLNNNTFNGSLPASWGAEGAWGKLESLELQHNRFTGARSACVCVQGCAWARVCACAGMV